MRKIGISIIIPVGPLHGQLAERAIASAEAQTVPVEIVTYHDTRGDGAGWARNRGVEQATGDLFVFLDADDELIPTFVEDTLPAFGVTGRYVYSGCRIVWGGDKPDEVWKAPVFDQRLFLNPRFQHGVTTLLPRPFFEAIGGFNETLPAWEDPDLYARLVKAGYCGTPVDKTLFTYHARDGYRRIEGLRQRGRLRKHFEQYQEGSIMACCGKKRKTVQAAVNSKTVAEVQASPPPNWVLAEYIKKGKVEVKGQSTKVKYPRGGSNDDPIYIHPRDAEAEINRPGGPLLRPLPMPDRNVVKKVEALRALVELQSEGEPDDTIA